jgi:hypothetical protein
MVAPSPRANVPSGKSEPARSDALGERRFVTSAAAEFEWARTGSVVADGTGDTGTVMATPSASSKRTTAG